MKVLSYGIFVTDSEQLLIVHPTHSKFWDIPKGKTEEGEKPIETAIRECREESGLVVDQSTLEDKGVFPYLKKKDLHLFIMKVPTLKLPDTSKMICELMVEKGKDKQLVPEVDKFMYVPIKELSNYLVPGMLNIAKTIFKI